MPSWECQVPTKMQTQGVGRVGGDGLSNATANPLNDPDPLSKLDVQEDTDVRERDTDCVCLHTCAPVRVGHLFLASSAPTAQLLLERRL